MLPKHIKSSVVLKALAAARQTIDNILRGDVDYIDFHYADEVAKSWVMEEIEFITSDLDDRDALEFLFEVFQEVYRTCILSDHRIKWDYEDDRLKNLVVVHPKDFVDLVEEP